LIGDHDLAIPWCDGFHHPLAALYRPRTVLPAIHRLLREDRLRPVYLMEILRTRVVSSQELRAVDPRLGTLRNLNSPEDYEAALADAGLALPERLPATQPARATSVLVEFFGVPRLKAGVSTLAVQAETLGEALLEVARLCPGLVGSVMTTSDGNLHPAYTLNLNGDRFTTDPATLLTEGDRLMILAVDVGG
jgi:molybdopterin converting factor small subunit